MAQILTRILSSRFLPIALVAFSLGYLASEADKKEVSQPEKVQAVVVGKTDEEVKAFDLAAVKMPNAKDHVSAYVNRSFRVPMAMAREIVDLTVSMGEVRDLDPLLILAVIGTESSYNPKARSGVGAEGLMQVMTSVHADKFEALGGVEKAFEPYANIVVGTEILQYLIRRTGSVRGGLKWYCGAANMKNDGGYADRVFNELSRLQVAAVGQVDKAVSLSYSKKSGPNVETGGRGEHLGFSRWTGD